MAAHAEVRVVADASFLIGICLIDQLSLLEKVVGKVYVAPAVWQEGVVQGAGRPGAQQVVAASFIECHPIADMATAESLKASLGSGEAETLILARELGCSVVLMDDLEARRTAEREGLHPVGLLGFLLEAKRRGAVDRIAPFIHSLAASNFRMGKKLIEKVLKAAGETGDPHGLP